MSIEKVNVSDTNEMSHKNGLEVPATHLENMNKEELEKMSPQEMAEKIGSNVYELNVKDLAGIKGAFQACSETGGKEEFAKKYSEYVNNPEKMKDESPKMYDFMRDRIFSGREYSIEEAGPDSQAEVAFGMKYNSLDIAATDSKMTEHTRDIPFTSTEQDVKHWERVAEEWYRKVQDYTKRVASDAAKGRDITLAKSQLESAQRQYENALRELQWARDHLEAS